MSLTGNLVSPTEILTLPLPPPLVIILLHRRQHLQRMILKKRSKRDASPASRRYFL
jgi:hypothetical protein